MGVAERAAQAARQLITEDDFRFYGMQEQTCGGQYKAVPLTNDVWWRGKRSYIMVEEFRFSHKKRFSVNIDGTYVPFATVQRESRRFPLPDKYRTRVEILPSMIPMATEALKKYKKEGLAIPDPDDSQEYYRQQVRGIEAVLKKLQEINTNVG